MNLSIGYLYQLYRAYRRHWSHRGNRPARDHWPDGSHGCHRSDRSNRPARDHRSDGFHGRYRPDRGNRPTRDHRSDGTHRRHWSHRGNRPAGNHRSDRSHRRHWSHRSNWSNWTIWGRRDSCNRECWQCYNRRSGNRGGRYKFGYAAKRHSGFCNPQREYWNRNTGTAFDSIFHTVPVGNFRYSFDF